MALPIAGQVGPQVVSDGTIAPLRLDRQASSIVGQNHARYRESVFRGNRYGGGNAAGVVTTVGTATTYTGLCLTNPINSGVNISIDKVGYGLLVVMPAASILGIMTGYNAATQVTQTTPVTVTNRLVGGTAGKGLLASSVTLPTAPTLAMVLAGLVTGAVTVVENNGGVIDLEGVIELPPGGYAAFFTSTITGAAGAAFSFGWEEIPVGQ